MGVNPEAIIVMGFSAGAGIVMMSATQWNTPGLAERLGIPDGGNRPNGAVVGYGAALHSSVLNNAEYIPPDLGKIARDRTPQLEFANYVGPHTPPMFIWHCRYDKYVPSLNPSIMARAMEKYNLPYELHLFQYGEHGMSVNNKLTNRHFDASLQNSSVGMWVVLCVNWMNKLFDF